MGSELEDGGRGIRQQVTGCSDEEAKEKVEEHLKWSGWRRGGEGERDEGSRARFMLYNV